MMKNLKLKTANVLAVIITALCFVFLFLLLKVEVPAPNKDLVNFLSGIMFGTGFGGVIYFLYNFKKDNTGQYSEYSEMGNTSVCPMCGATRFNTEQIEENSEKF